jgi:hypothetical protein
VSESQCSSVPLNAGFAGLSKSVYDLEGPLSFAAAPLRADPTVLSISNVLVCLLHLRPPHEPLSIHQIVKHAYLFLVQELGKYALCTGGSVGCLAELEAGMVCGVWRRKMKHESKSNCTSLSDSAPMG